MKKNIIPYYVIIFDINKQEFETYDIMKYLISSYNETKKSLRPKTEEECKKFIIKETMHMFWSRCEYEIILNDWPNLSKSKKIDVYWQVVNNLEVVINIFMQNI